MTDGLRCASPSGRSDLLDERHDECFEDLMVDAPCCGGRTSLNNLHYEWPCGFARFELALWNPGRGWLTDEELSALARALGRPVRQIFAHMANPLSVCQTRGAI